MSQKQIVDAAIDGMMRRLRSAVSESEQELKEAWEALCKAQNGPPDGEGDGSFTAEEWSWAAHKLESLGAFARQLERMRSE